MINTLKLYCERKNNEDADNDFGDGGTQAKIELD